MRSDSMENRRVRIVNKRLIPGVVIPGIWEPRTFSRVSRFFELHLTGPKALEISQSDRASALATSATPLATDFESLFGRRGAAPARAG
jgi:hypothetical protein